MKNDMTQGNIARALTAFTVPLILSGVFQQLFNWADAFIVGNVEGGAVVRAAQLQENRQNFRKMIDNRTITRYSVSRYP